jgi:ATP-dependent RNA helicase RhlE
VERVEQQLLYIEAPRKRALLVELFEDPKMVRALVFTRTKRGADRVAKYLEAADISAAAIHGDKSQSQRERALASFKAGKVRALIATDIAARGIDVDGVSHVIQYELPQVPESYVHRIGRTARAGAGGVAISFCADDERGLLRDIQKLTRQTLPAFDRRNDKRLGEITAATTSGPAAEQSLPAAKPRQPHAQHRSAKPHNHRPNSHAGKPAGDGRGPQRQGSGRGGKPNTSGKAAGWTPLKA